jgi:alpha-glucosidase
VKKESARVLTSRPAWEKSIIRRNRTALQAIHALERDSMSTSFTKYPHPANFAFADRYDRGTLRVAGRALHATATDVGKGIHRIQVAHGRLWPENKEGSRHLTRATGGNGGHGTRLELSEAAGLRLSTARGKVLLEADAGGWFGLSGRRWLFRFRQQPDMQFYGLGEKHTSFERSGRSYWFWNSDAWADHSFERVRDGDYDPDYISIPYLVIKQRNAYIGLLLDSVYPSWIALGAHAAAAGAFGALRETAAEIVLGGTGGAPSLTILQAPSLAALTRRFQRLTGTAPLPPLWSLGYHQSRWGYRSAADLVELADRFEQHRFPADGLWLDIDYMDGYRVFTIDPHALPRPAATIAALRQRGFRVVPILDPGVKQEAGYRIFDDGRARDVFCRNTAGGLFTGLVWPGRTVFPDFVRSGVRRWWAGHARRFFALGFEGAWLDMNDPSTGDVDARDMRFDRGRLPHAAGRNAYALLMARATRDGLRAAHPDRRPFLLSRSGSTGAQRYCAHWTGDNFSTYGHLRRSIGKALNLALSGLAFNGADVGGFGGDCSEALAVDWFKAAFLMPFLRNHTMRGSRPQEPWAYSRRALAIIRRFVRLRYTLLPYLYNLFCDHAERGEAILRPLFYDFPDTADLPLGGIDDQFMVGPALMQAPFVEEDGPMRDVVLPEVRWLRADTGQWQPGGQRLRVRRQVETTPLFVRDGSLVSFQPGRRITNRTDLNHIGLLCCLSPGFDGQARCVHNADDGVSPAYRRGARTRLDMAARVAGRGLRLSIKTRAQGFGPVAVTPFTVNRFRSLHLIEDGMEKRLQPVKVPMRLTGKPFDVYRWK